MAPERLLDTVWFPRVSGPSKESDIYSLCMTSFSVRPSVVKHPVAQHNPPLPQVLTEIFPYTEGDNSTIAQQILRGKRPSRPVDPRQNQWLQDPIWGVIVTGWRVKPERRCKLSAPYQEFLTAGQREAQNIKPGN